MRKQVKEGMELAEVAKKGVDAFYAITGNMPANNDQAGVPSGGQDRRPVQSPR